MARITLISCGLAAALLGGCGAIQQANDQKLMEERMAQLRIANEGCNSRYPQKIKDSVARASCYTENENKFIVTAHPDLWRVYQTKRQALAVRVQQGSVTPEDASAILAEEQSRFVSEETRRNQGAEMVDAQQRASRAAAWQAYQASQPRSVNCMRVGNTVSCN